MAPTLPPLSTFFRHIFVLFFLVLLSSCSTDDTVVQETGKDLVSEIVPSSKVYKGIFASSNHEFRGIFQLDLPGGKKDLDYLNLDATASVTIQTGEIFNVKAVDLVEKSSNFKIFFESEDLSFNFTLDENDNPLNY
jgi:hypothetical protein